MRPKKSKSITAALSGVAEGLPFDHDLIENQVIEEEAEKEKSCEELGNAAPEKASRLPEPNADSKYTKYYHPHPKKGSHGGNLGRRTVQASERKIQFSVTCTPDDKERYRKAAQRDHRKLPDLVTTAIDEYIRNHNLE